MYETPIFSQKFTKGGVFLLNINGKNHFKNNIIKRNYFIFVCITLMFVGLATRLAYVQLTEGPDLAVSANRQYYYEEYVNNLTFNLLDNKGENLFNYISRYYVVVDPITFYTLNEESAFVDMRKVLYILRDYDKDYDISDLQSEMDKGSRKYEVDKETYNKIKGLNTVKGVYAYEFDDYDKTINSNIKNILVNPLNTNYNSKMKDEGTLEMEIYNYVKDNYKDKIRFEKDVSENIVGESKVVNGENRNVKTTLDKKVQESVEKILRSESYSDYDQISAVLMESSTGKILAMAQKDDWLYNPNIATGTKGYLIGSTFKTFLYELALEKNLVDENEIFDNYDPTVYPNSKEPLGEYTMNGAYVISSNRIFFKIALRVGVDNMYRMAKVQGLFDPVLNLHDEGVGTMEGYGVEENIDIVTNTAIGQTTRSTPLGVLAIANTVVNKGVYVKPYILDSVVQNDGTVVDEFTTVTNRVISETTASTIKDGMISVVEEGTAYGYAQIEGVEVGGKTGTAERLVDEKLVSDGWFSGFFNYEGKYYTMVIYIPSCEKVEKVQSTTAAQVFKDIVEELIGNNFLE